jgi:hypothetical protein
MALDNYMHLVNSTEDSRCVLARFVRRDESTYGVLVEWLPTTPAAADLLGPDLYRAARATRWDDDPAVHALRRRIWAQLEPSETPHCLCSEWRDRVRVNLGSDTVDLLSSDFEVVRPRNPWIDLVRCATCGQPWYAAVDTVDDDYYLRRLSDTEVSGIVERDEWPRDYDDFANVWPLLPGQEFRGRLQWPWQGENV